jgi:hypothetical protein
MAWTYSGKPSSSERDQVRFLIGDTKDCDQIIQDEEIEYLLDLEGSVFRAAAMACETIAAQFSRLADEKVGDISVSLSQKADAYLKLAKKLRNRSSGIVFPYAGGISQTDKDTQEQDEDRVPGIFKRHMQESVPETVDSEQPTYNTKYRY